MAGSACVDLRRGSVDARTGTEIVGLAALQVVRRVEVIAAATRSHAALEHAPSKLPVAAKPHKVAPEATVFSFLRVALFVSFDVVLYLLVLLMLLFLSEPFSYNMGS